MKPRLKKINTLSELTLGDVEKPTSKKSKKEEVEVLDSTKVTDKTPAKPSKGKGIPLPFRFDTRTSVAKAKTDEEPTKKKVDKDIKMTKAKKAKVALEEKKEDLETQPKKTTVLLPYTPNKTLFDPETAQDLQDKFKYDVVTFTAVKEILERTDTGTPQKVLSESGSELRFLSGNGVLYHFSNDPELKSDESLTVDPDFESSDISKKVKPPETSQKTVSITVSSQLLKEVAQQIKENNGRRCKTQNKVMGGSATQYSHEARISIKNKSEWAHLAAHRFLSNLSQIPENLVATTNHANTEMIPVEDFVDAIARNQLGKVKLVATAHLVGKTQIATSIDYDVCIASHIFHFSFKGQQLNKPDIANKQSMDALFAVLLANKKFGSEKSKEPLNLKTEGLPNMFFSRSEHVAAIEKEKAKAKTAETKPVASTAKKTT